jgi:uncharacterized protein (DUF2252 family)
MLAVNHLVYPERNIWEPMPSIRERMALGKQQRLQVPRDSHAISVSLEGRVDPVSLLIDSNTGRLPELIPIRYGRMLTSPFAFMRGSAAIMGEDLSHLPNSGIFVQCCGDCHLMNFGGYATPERNLVFDINDFDETIPAPFEWDVKRLASSIIVAGRYKEFSEKENKEAASRAVVTYTEKMREFSAMRQLDLWYNRLDEGTILDMFKADKDFVSRVKESTEKARRRTHEFVFPKITELQNGNRRIIDDPPLIFHLENSDDIIKAAHPFFDAYFESLADDKKELLNRYRLDDFAIKVVGVGSVGTRCLVGLFSVSDTDAIILQFKQGNASVLEKHAGRSLYSNHGERIVHGQRLMQTVSDIFLGWSRTRDGFDFYVRQLRDMKSTANLDTFTPKLLVQYAAMCGWALARSHAKAGRSAEISGYIGKSEVFAQAITAFAVQYANQTESDFRLLQEAEKSKRIEVVRGK